MKPMMRRTWLASPLAAFAKSDAETFHQQNVLGTTLEMQVRGGGGREAFDACLAEVERLRRLLSTYDASSAVSRWMASRETAPMPAELRTLLGLYAEWQRRTEGAISSKPAGRLDVNALGKSYIIEKAIDAAAMVAPEASAILLNIGGDISVRGGDWEVDVCDPLHWHENARPLARVRLDNAAVSTSGGYERGAAHLVDPRTGKTAGGALSATVVAADAITANALSTALCVLSPEEGLRLVERVPGASAIVADRAGGVHRSSGLGRLEQPLGLPVAAASGWPGNSQVQITLTLRAIEGYRVRRPYVAVWAEDMSGKLVRNITVWTERRRWLPDLFEWWKKSGGAGGGASVTRATRPPGRYQLLWDGLDDAGQPVGPGKYRIVVESNREHGGYAKESAILECGAQPAKAVTKENGEFEAVQIVYGPVSQPA